MTTPPRTVLIAGGSGFIGSELRRRLERRQWRVRVLSRSPRRGDLTWRDLECDGLPPCDAVVNLAGKHILDPRRLWIGRYRNEVLASRIESTRRLVQAINAAPVPPEVFLSVSGKCIYGTSPSARFDEQAAPGTDFPGRLCEAWEVEARGVRRDGVRYVQVRTGIVLGNMHGHPLQNGILPLLRLAFEHGLGACYGSGEQVFAWVHVDDLLGILERGLTDQGWHGVYNAVAPARDTNREFMDALAHSLGRRRRWRIPAPLVRMLVGAERAPILLQGQHVLPTRTLAHGYRFVHSELHAALAALQTRHVGGVGSRSRSIAGEPGVPHNRGPIESPLTMR